MKVLHIFSMAGVAEMLCEPGDTVLQLDQFDTMGFAEHYGVTARHKDLLALINNAEQIESEYDKIIIHDFQEYKQYFAKDKVILFFHGSKLRSMDEVELTQVRQYPCIVSTPDLLDILPNATYLPTPVDLELFEHFVSTGDDDTWLCMNREYQRDIIEPKIREKYPKIEYMSRKDNIINYEDMPAHLSQYDNYVDWKFTYDKPVPKSISAASCTGIQALAVGLNVFDHNGMKLERNLLAIHDSKRIRQRFREEIGRTT